MPPNQRPPPPTGKPPPPPTKAPAPAKPPASASPAPGTGARRNAVTGAAQATIQRVVKVSTAPVTFRTRQGANLPDKTWVYLFRKDGKTFKLEHELKSDDKGGFEKVDLTAESGKTIRATTPLAGPVVIATLDASSQNVQWYAVTSMRQLLWSKLTGMDPSREHYGEEFHPWTPTAVKPNAAGIYEVKLKSVPRPCTVTGIKLHDGWSEIPSDLLVTIPNAVTPERLVVLPRPSNVVSLSFGSELLETLAEGPFEETVEALKHIDKISKAHRAKDADAYNAAVDDWRDDVKKEAKKQKDKAGDAWEVYGVLSKSQPLVDKVRIRIDPIVSNCALAGHEHTPEVVRVGNGPVELQWDVKENYHYFDALAPDPATSGIHASANVYRVTCKSCEPGDKRRMVAEVHVLPASTALLGAKWIPKFFNGVVKDFALQVVNSILSPMISINLEMGAFCVEGMMGWSQGGPNQIEYVRELRLAAKPLVDVSVEFKLSFVMIGTGIPPQLLQFIGDIGVFLKVGGALEASLSFAYKYEYKEGSTYSLKGGFVGGLYAEFGLYVQLGAKGLAEVGITAGFRVGISFPAELELEFGERIIGKIGAMLEPIKFRIVLRTKFLWVFSYNKTFEWVLREAKTVLRDPQTPYEIYRWPQPKTATAAPLPTPKGTVTNTSATTYAPPGTHRPAASTVARTGAPTPANKAATPAATGTGTPSRVVGSPGAQSGSPAPAGMRRPGAQPPPATNNARAPASTYAGYKSPSAPSSRPPATVSRTGAPAPRSKPASNTGP